MEAPTVKLGRRVLGDVAVNTAITPSKYQSQSPLAKSSSGDTYAFSFEVHHISEAERSPISKKRKIGELSGVVVPGTRSSIEQTPARNLSPSSTNTTATQTSQSEMASCDHSIDEKESAMQLASFRNTQEPATSFPMTAESQKSSLESWSSFQDGMRTSSTSQANMAEESLPTPPSSQSSIKERAEKLRFGLRLAMFKVETNQIQIPFDELNLDAPVQKAVKKDATQYNCKNLLPSPLPNSPPPSSRPFGLLPAPLLVPTAYSTRSATDDYMPSSPPESTGTIHGDDRRVEDHEFATPMAPRSKIMTQLSSPPDSQERGTDKLTSSVVKGRAASGLLELMHTG